MRAHPLRTGELRFGDTRSGDTAAGASADERIRCDLCGRPVIDPDAHLFACVQHEVNTART